jgi:SAM-dependent methyltransferase
MTAIDKQWEKIHKEKPWGKYPSEDVVRFIARNFFNKTRKNIKILDLGCGAGANTWFIAREGFATYAFDGSHQAMIKCNKNVEQPSCLFQADASKIPVRDTVFDAIVDSAVISANTNRNAKKILKECFRVLKAGGKFFSTGLFLPETTGYESGEKVDEFCFRNLELGPLENVGTIHFFTRKSAEFLFKEAGFKNIQIDSTIRTLENEKEKVAFLRVTASKLK